MQISEGLLAELRLYLLARQQQEDATARRLLAQLEQAEEESAVQAALAEPELAAFFASVPPEEAVRC